MPEPIRLADLDILRDRVRFPACRRSVARLFLLASWAPHERTPT